MPTLSNAKAATPDGAAICERLDAIYDALVRVIDELQTANAQNRISRTPPTTG